MSFRVVRQEKDSRLMSDPDILLIDFKADPCQLMAISFLSGSLFKRSLHWLAIPSSVLSVNVKMFSSCSHSCRFVGRRVMGRCLFFLWYW